ncbi:hypothetical protein EB241_14090 [Erwinia psidii]|uniref:Uncharacterized protein n=1 Tax=Erwinia psidii TaxID=69224 RepID=A0A3N6RX41_9GAMM|nr:hypothetical protein EB241_14090 [Erwinia psidii]
MLMHVWGGYLTGWGLTVLNRDAATCLKYRWDNVSLLFDAHSLSKKMPAKTIIRANTRELDK